MPRGKNSYDQEIGRRVKFRRMELRVSQAAVGDALGITFQQIQKYENGANRISAGRLKQIAALLKVPVTYFYDENIGGSQQNQTLFTMIDTAHSLRLVRAFSRIRDKRVQQKMIELAESLADKTAKH